MGSDSLACIRLARRVNDENNPERVAMRRVPVPARVPRSGRGILRVPGVDSQSCEKAHTDTEAAPTTFIRRQNSWRSTYLVSVHSAPRGTPRGPSAFSSAADSPSRQSKYTSNPTGARIWARSAAVRETMHRQHSSWLRFVGLLSVLFVVEGISRRSSTRSSAPLARSSGLARRMRRSSGC